MRSVVPQVFCLAEPQLNIEELERYFDLIDAGEWWDSYIQAQTDQRTKTVTEPESLVEIASRNCYQSFGVGLNPNITRVRADSGEHLMNVLRQNHGSVLEHANFSFMFANVSRVFTHELVRHRVGVAISQESLRYVRLTELKGYAPTDFDSWAKSKMMEVFKYLEGVQNEFAEHFKLDEEKDFGRKKRITSAMRRLAPIGLATKIMWTANVRTLRYVIPLRTHPSAEEEMRLVFSKVGQICKEKCPMLFNDFTWHPDDHESGFGQWCCTHQKV